LLYIYSASLLALGWPFLPHEAIVAGLLAEGFLRLAVAIA
jgi:hypothetical protein